MWLELVPRKNCANFADWVKFAAFGDDKPITGNYSFIIPRPSPVGTHKHLMEFSSMKKLVAVQSLMVLERNHDWLLTNPKYMESLPVENKVTAEGSELWEVNVTDLRNWADGLEDEYYAAEILERVAGRRPGALIWIEINDDGLYDPEEFFEESAESFAPELQYYEDGKPCLGGGVA